MNKLSIIIPCYNCERTLKEAFDSCLIQNLDIPYEIIMVDDGSTDGTKELMPKLRDLAPDKVKLFYHNKNRGGGATRNTAVENSTGNLIFCLDSDDILPDGTLKKMSDYLIKKSCDGVAFNYLRNFKGDDANKIDHTNVMPYVDQLIPVESLLEKPGVMCPLSIVFLYTKAAFRLTKGYPTEHGFDTQGFAWRFLTAGLKAYTCPETSYLHRINFNDSYYLREYNAGRINYNWRKILMENYNLFSKKAQDFILSFDYRDITRNVFSELSCLDEIFRKDYAQYLGKDNSKTDLEDVNEPIKRNSLRGIYLRIKSLVKKFYRG